MCSAASIAPQILLEGGEVGGRGVTWDARAEHAYSANLRNRRAQGRKLLRKVGRVRWPRTAVSAGVATSPLVSASGVVPPQSQLAVGVVSTPLGSRAPQWGFPGGWASQTMYWSQTESSKCSRNFMFNQPRHPFMNKTAARLVLWSTNTRFS